MCVLVYIFLTGHYNILAPPALMEHQILLQVCINTKEQKNYKVKRQHFLTQKTRLKYAGYQQAAVKHPGKDRDVILEKSYEWKVIKKVDI